MYNFPNLIFHIASIFTTQFVCKLKGEEKSTKIYATADVNEKI